MMNICFYKELLIIQNMNHIHAKCYGENVKNAVILTWTASHDTLKDRVTNLYILYICQWLSEAS